MSILTSTSTGISSLVQNWCKEKLSGKSTQYRIEKSSDGTMKTYIDLLKNDSFMLCNQCYFVNLKYVREVTSDYVLVGENKLSISKIKLVR